MLVSWGDGDVLTGADMYGAKMLRKRRRCVRGKSDLRLVKSYQY